MAMVAWAMGWEGYYRKRFLAVSQSIASTASEPTRAITSGSAVNVNVHRRLEMYELCTMDGLLDEMRAHERYDVRLHRFARVLFEQRLGVLPEDARRLVHEAQSRTSITSQAPGAQARHERVDVDVCGRPVQPVEVGADEEARGLTADDVAIWPDEA